MPPTGFHGLLGLAIAGKVDSKAGKIGIAWGSVFPDIDLFGSAITYILTQNTHLTIHFHRSITHSLVIMGLILVTGVIVPRLTTRDYSFLYPFVLGLVIGMLLHVTMDLFYLDGVSLYWPLTTMDDRFTLVETTFNDLSPAHNHLLTKVIATLDGGFESIYFLIFTFLATRYHTDNELNFSINEKSLSIRNWPSKLKLFALILIGITIFFIFLAFSSISWPEIDRDAFIILLYIPLTPVYLLSSVLPILMRKTVEEVSY